MRIVASSATAVAALLVAVVALKGNVGISAPPVRRVGRRSAPGLDVSLHRFWLTVGAAAASAFLAVLALTGLWMVALVPSVVVATLPRAYYARRRSMRLAEVEAAWPDGLRDLVSSVRSGSSLAGAVENMAAFGPAPLREAFQGFGVYSRSLGVVPALEMIRDDLGDATSDRVIEVLILAHERGGTVVPEILTDLAQATTRDIWASEEMRTEALEHKINSRVVFVLPWLVLIVITSRSDAFREFYSTTAGLLVVAVGGAASLVGIFLASRLGRSPIEPRVFGR